MDVSERCDKACEILRLTNDGDNLDPKDLALLEGAVNGCLTEEGYKVFETLHQEVVRGGYKKPWFHGVENMTIDHEGYVYWKDQQVEHFSRPWAWSSEAAKQLKELAERCKQLETKGVEVNVVSAVWRWPQTTTTPLA